MNRLGCLTIAAAIAALGITISAQAQPYGPMGGGYGPGYGMIGGYGYGHMMGPGMMGGGYMMGPGMRGGYGPGYMMGQGMMGGYGPGMMGGYGYGPQGYGLQGYGSGNLNLSTDQVKGYLERMIASQGNPRLKVGEVKEKDADTIVADIVTKDNSLVQRFVVNRHNGFYQPEQ